MTTADVDLNLLRVFDAILTEGSVVRAAAQLHLSPPAVSRSLGRLRKALDDPLFIRSGRDLVPTARAVELRSDVRGALEGALSVLKPAAEIQPQNWTRRFIVTAGDVLVVAAGTKLVEQVQADAPGVDIDFLPDAQESELLCLGRSDLDLGVAPTGQVEIESEPLFVDEYVVVVRAGHRLTKQALTPKRYAEGQHLSVSRKGRANGPVDDALAKLGLGRTRVSTVPSFLVAAHMLAGSNLVGLMPRSAAETIAPALGLQALPFSSMRIELDLPQVTISQSWHIRNSNDPASLWLRDHVRTCVTVRPLRRR